MPSHRALLQPETRIRTTLPCAVSGLLCLTLLAPVDLLAARPKPSHSPVRKESPVAMNAQQRVLHALNRLTFGPRPGDEVAVSRMGLDAWFEKQLHPDRIPDGDLEERLANYPAMQLRQAELLQRFPSPGMLRRYSNGGLDAPADPTERTIYADAALSYAEKREARKEIAATVSVAAGAGSAAAVAPKSATPVIAGSPLRKAVPPADPPTMDEAATRAILALPPAARMGRLLAMSPEEMQALRAALKGNGEGQLSQGMAPAEREEVAAMQAPLRVVGTEATATRLLRDVYSERQLQAVMTDFWLNHFNVYDRKDQDEPYLLPAYERETILPHTLGRFEDLLIANAESPAMLRYLDNWTSVGPGSKAAQRAGNPRPPGMSSGQTSLPAKPVSAKQAGNMPAQGINENYARELMELHTLGVNGGYTQSDVIEVAKCFTGWTLQPPAQGGGFTFNPNRHEPGPKTVLGHTIPEGGENEGLEVLHILAASPQTAHFVSLELAERFVSDTPPPAIVERMTAAYLRHDGDISAVLETMFHSPQFWSAPVYRAKVKTPLEFVVSALRASDADVTNPVPLLGAMNRLGMPVYGMQTPNGYSWQADAWVSTNALVTRMNFALTLSGNHLNGTRPDWARVLGAETAPNPAIEQASQEVILEKVILGEPASLKTRMAVLAQANDPSTERVAEQGFRAIPVKAEGARVTASNPLAGTPPAIQAASSAMGTPITIMAGLLLGSPDFQRR